TGEAVRWWPYVDLCWHDPRRVGGGGSRVILACLEVVRHVPRFRWCIFCSCTVPPRSHRKQQQQTSNRARLVCWCSTGKTAVENITVSVPREGTEPAAKAS
ncbi:unnamed protein product, partial [Ectocarpus sp. 12 AP-2014]